MECAYSDDDVHEIQSAHDIAYTFYDRCKLNFTLYSSLFSKVVLLDSSLQLPPHVLVIPSPSNVLLLETEMGSPSGEWMGAVSALSYIVQQVPLVLVVLAVLSQLHLGLGLEQVLLPTHQH